MNKLQLGLSMLCGFLAFGAGTQAATLNATYIFNNTLTAQESAAPALAATNPLGANTFTTDTVYGSTRTVYAFNGNAAPVNQQAGLTFNSSGLISPTSYSLEMVFDFTNANGFRRILDVQNRQSDNGVYSDSNHLRLYASGTGGQGSIASNVYSDVIITNDGTRVAGYLNGVQQFLVQDSQLNLNNSNNPNQLINLFLDNTAGAGAGEFSSGRIALFKAYDGVLSATDAARIAADPFASTGGPTPAPVPEPASCSLVGGALLTAIYVLRKQQKN